MEKYFLDIITIDGRVEDPEGYLFSNLEMAKVEAVAAVREMAATLIKTGSSLKELQIEVRDAARLMVVVVSAKDVLH